MLNTPGKPLIVFLTCITLLAAAGCTAASTTGTAATISRQVPVQRGDLVVSVSVDGNLVMPQAFTLNFGAPGDIKEVLVTEGDRVKAGAMLARLDDTSQRLDVKTANNSVQTVLSNLYETVPRLPQFPGVYYTGTIPDPDDPKGLKVIYLYPEGVHDNPVYQMYYPNATALTSYAWAREEIALAYGLFYSENYTAAASELYVALSDLEACEKIIEDALNNPESGLGNIEPFVPTDSPGLVYFEVQLDTPMAVPLIVDLRKAVDSIHQGQDEISKVRELVAQGKSTEVGPQFETLLSRVDDIGKAVMMDARVIKLRNDTTVYGKNISLFFYGAAEEKLNAALAGIQKGGLNSPELNDNLRIARHYMELCNGILGSNDYVLQHGLSLKAEQGFKVDLEKAMVNLGNTKDNFLNTVILAPVDGIVVNVSMKKNDVLSQQDYSSKGTIQIVDTSQIKFQGTVDEIDIMKINTGQKATVSVDAMPNKTFTGKVSFISPFGATDTSNVVKFNVTIMLDPSDIDLKGGLTATADVGISTVANALIVPLSAVTTTGTSSTVTVATGDKGQTEKREVTLGIQNQQYVQILKGLNEGDTVIIIDKASGAPVSTTMGPPGGGPPRDGGPPPGR
jgi:multidrug efflux pump subunit AcrA (membrane-fusion protein)